MKAYSNYKDSGVSGIEQIPKHWILEKIKFVATCNDEVLSDSTADDEIINYVEIGDVDYVNGITNTTEYEFKEAPSRARRITRPNDIIIYTVRTYLKAIAKIAEPDLIVSTGFAVIRPRKIDKIFMSYALLAPTFIEEVMSRSFGVSYPAIKASSLMNIKICIPPLSEQQAIASYLDAKTKPIDDIIAKREKQIELLEEMKSAIISRAVTKGLNPDAKMKDSGIEWIKTEPQSWETRRIKNVITLLTDYDANGSFADIAKNVKVNVGEPYAWMVRATDLANKRYGIVDDNNYCNKETYDFLSKSSLEAGDILIAKRGDIGKSYEVPKCDCPMTLAPNTYLLKTNKKVIRNRFFHYFFMSDYGKKQLSINNKSTTIGAIYKDDVKNLKILLPPMDEQQAIASYLDTETSKIDYRIAKRRKQIELLQEYKQALITAAVTGKIDVRDNIL
jgi:type I restriction enzyme S subunit